MMNHSVKIGVLMLFVLFSPRSMAQIVGNCKVKITAAYRGKQYKMESDKATLTLNSKSGDLYLRMKLNSIDAELNTVDDFMEGRDDEMVFYGNIGTSLFDLLNNEENSGKDFPIEGSVLLNQLTIKNTGRFNVLKINNERDELLKNIRFSLFFNFMARDFALDKYYPGLTGAIDVQVNEAVVNVEE
jgi:hypothetical protein